MLQCENITKQYGKFTALNDFNLEIEKGSIYGLIGHNGAGKTTLFKILAGLIRQYSGSIFFEGQQVKDIGTKNNSRFLFENPIFYDDLSAFENLSIAARLNRSCDKKKVIDMLDQIGLGKFRNKKLSAFSRGMKQRLALAVIEYDPPEVLILDEPTNGLDIVGILGLEDHLKHINKEYGSTILLSSHYIEQIQRICGRVCVIKNGEKIYDESVDEFKNNFSLDFFKT